MTRKTLSLLTLAALTLATGARADTLRCGKYLIAEGAMQTEVREKCGPPDETLNVSEPTYARNAYGYMFQTGTITKTIWRYKRAPGKFPAVLTFEGGELKKLEFEK
ncbi:MAG TPA: DUF2845 domain-containing protein [Steroidobacteraceae bacterium]|nr:DUF2845 domain-containing protein [Steroidobacteraceae bacterium]